MNIFWNLLGESSAPRGLRWSGGGQIQHGQGEVGGTVD